MIRITLNMQKIFDAIDIFTVLICQEHEKVFFLFNFSLSYPYCYRIPPLPWLSLLLDSLLFCRNYYEWDIFLFFCILIFAFCTLLEMFTRFKFFLAKYRGTFNAESCQLQIKTVWIFSFPIVFLFLSLSVQLGANKTEYLLMGVVN